MPRPAFSKSAIARLLEASTSPAYLLDERRRITYANAALLGLMGVTAEALAGQQCNYHTGPAADRKPPFVAGLCPPLTVFEDGHSLQAHVLIQSGSESVERRNAHFWPLRDADRNTIGVLALVEEVAGAGATGDAIRAEQDFVTLHDLIARQRMETHCRYDIDQLVGSSTRSQRVRDQIRMASESLGRVVVCGPRGSGREHTARVIHTGRFGNPAPLLVPLACPLLDAELLRSTVNAFVQQCAELETAEPPSLLLTDVDQLSLEAQLELEGFLAITELGLRTIATSRFSLLELAATSGFRTDLANLLSVLEIALPTLAARLEDIPVLAQSFVERYNAQCDQPRNGFSLEALEQMVAYPWPGNIDELQEVVFRCCRHARGSVIDASELPREIRLGLDAVVHPPIEPKVIDLEKTLVDVESKLIRRALANTKQNKAEAARRLGISRNKLLRRIAHLGLE